MIEKMGKVKFLLVDGDNMLYKQKTKRKTNMVLTKNNNYD